MKGECLIHKPAAQSRLPHFVVDGQNAEAFRIGLWQAFEVRSRIPWPSLVTAVCVHAFCVAALAFWQEPRFKVTSAVYMVTFLPEIDEMDSNPVRSGESGFAVSQSSAEEKQALPPTVPPVQSAPATVSEVTRRAPPAQNVTGNRPADSASAVAASPAFSGLSNYWETVRAAVARSVRYPSVAVREGIEGTIALRLTLDTQGNLVEAVPLEGSSDILVQSALGAARRAAPFPMPTVCSESGPSAILPIHFQLRQ